jgi:hypothetical protein
VPSVAQPKNLKSITDPCQLLTAQQLQDLSATANAKPGKSEWGEATCDWRNNDVAINLSPDTARGKGISQIYQTKANFDNFQPSEVGNHPAVRVDHDENTCALFVGTSDTQELYVHVFVFRKTNPHSQDSCGYAEQVAAAVLTNLPTGG